MDHLFIFSPGTWIGEGKITFSTSPEFIKFYTKWQFTEDPSGLTLAIQKVEMQGIDEHVVNYFRFEKNTPESFNFQLESEAMGSVQGTGIIKPKTIAWEFRSSSSVEGFEIYELQENGDYVLHAEYSSPDQHRTIIDGLIWKKGS